MSILKGIAIVAAALLSALVLRIGLGPSASPRKPESEISAISGTADVAKTDNVSPPSGVSSVLDDQLETIKLTPPLEAVGRMSVPRGFHVSLFESEPVVRQPIAMATDARGRLWVAENNTYAAGKKNFDLSRRDRIIILEDTDHDGRADRHTVFWDQGQRLTSVELGFGGVWALCPPSLLFIPDRDGDDVPDGPPQIVLDGWSDDDIHHNIANGLRWGPDGWLYGRHGILRTSLVGAPGTLPNRRTEVNCGIWRYHPTTKKFEVVCRGTTNPWGMDWNAEGELFFINTVIGHLWHGVPGAHFQRMFGEGENSHLYTLMGQTADHYHFGAADPWFRNNVAPTLGARSEESRLAADISASAAAQIGPQLSTEMAGGGHAHCGLLIYQEENWPAPYRGTLFTVNLNGRRVNNDQLERRGSGYVGRHAPDFLRTSDPWFRGIELLAGPDGGVYLADWCDIGECHEDDGVHRSSGRIYKIVYGQPAASPIADVARLSDSELIRLQLRNNEWLVRQSRRILQERAAAGLPLEEVHAQLREIVTTDPDPVHKLRALWCLHVTGGDWDDWLVGQLRQPDEHFRAWAVRLLGDAKCPPSSAVRAFVSLASHENSGLVLLYLASALQRLAPGDRFTLAEALSDRADFADDPVLPLMVWYGLEPAVPQYPARSVSLAASSRMPSVSQSIARRLTEDLAAGSVWVDQLVVLAAGQLANPVPVAQGKRQGEGVPDKKREESAARGRAILAGMGQTLRGWRKMPMPPSWDSAAKTLAANPDERIRSLVREMSVVFGDARALDEVFQIAAGKGSLDARRDALRILASAQCPSAPPLLLDLLCDRDLGPDAARGLAAFDAPIVAPLLMKKFPKLEKSTQAALIVTLSSRPHAASLLLDAIAAGKIDRGAVPMFQIRQMASFPDENVRQSIAKLWPELKRLSAAKWQRINHLRGLLTASALSNADPARGHRRFVQACATCHALFGEGGRIGPDLTGSQRTNLEFLLDNIVDPSATVIPAYRMSTVVLADGRVLNGIIGDRKQPTVAIQTPTERLVIDAAEIEEVRKSDLSLMPEGLLDVLSDLEIRDLFAYLMSPGQVPMATDGERGGPRAMLK